MKLFYKILFTVLLITVNSVYSADHGMAGFEFGAIDAVKNAYLHNNMGNIYLNEKNYNAALKEYEIAFKLTADTNSSSTYAYNIARCHILLNNYEVAKYFIEEAIKKDCINMTYYEALVDCYIKLKVEEQELIKCLNDDINPYSRIIAGLIYLKTGQKLNAKIIFDEFSANNPDMIITNDVRMILKNL